MNIFTWIDEHILGRDSKLIRRRRATMPQVPVSEWVDARAEKELWGMQGVQGSQGVQGIQGSVGLEEPTGPK